MKIQRFVLRVSDLDKAATFWSESVGFDLLQAMGTFAFLDAGAVQLVLNQVSEVLGSDSQTELVIEVEDFEADHGAMLERGVPFEVEPRPVTSDGDRELMAAHFRDPDGNLASVTGWVARRV